ncbi:hypothetical protein GLOIN_2v1792427 [Rhizophagus irregularis DAOM 181602=DAOM 197198]|nr:hypothetical protein GLOIN_2v1792427 [Rhizophagus irregularis DAOM 181602=DAOM 197198]
MKKGRFFNFNLQNSDNPNVRKRQQARFERKCRKRQKEKDNIIKSPTDDNNSTLNTSVAFADPLGGLTYSKLSKKDKKNLQPLKVEPMYKDGKLHSSLSHNEKKTLRPLQDKWFNGKTTTEIALYRDNLTIALTHYQNVCYDYHTYLRRQHSPIASSSLPPTKGKKKQKGRATDPDFNIKQLQILEETMDESGLHLALTVRHNKLYEPEYVTHQAPRQLKRSATRNFNSDLHYNLHMRKRFHHFTEDSALVTNFCSN